MTVLTGWKECGPYQITEQLSSPRNPRRLPGSSGIGRRHSHADARATAALGLDHRRGVHPENPFHSDPVSAGISNLEFFRARRRTIGNPRRDPGFFAPTRNHLRTLSRLATLSDHLKSPVTGDQRRQAPGKANPVTTGGIVSRSEPDVVETPCPTAITSG